MNPRTLSLLSEFNKAFVVLASGILLVAGGNWMWTNRDSLKYITEPIIMGEIMTGKTWEEHQAEDQYGPFDEAMWWPASRDNPGKPMRSLDALQHTDHVFPLESFEMP